MKTRTKSNKKGAVLNQRGFGSSAKKIGSKLDEIRSGVVDFSRKFLVLPWRKLGVTGIWMIAITGLFFAQKSLWNYLDQPISKLKIAGEIEYLTEESLRPVLVSAIGKGFFSADIDLFRQKVVALPWVKDASVSRVWPDQLSVTIEEQVPVALWNEVAYLNPFGEAFQPKELIVDLAGMPKLFGPNNREKAVLREYVEMSKQLASGGVELKVVKLEPRGAWNIVVDDDLSVKLGSEELRDKLSRFVKVYQGYLKEHRSKMEAVDARYTNGISVAWSKTDLAVEGS